MIPAGALVVGGLLLALLVAGWLAAIAESEGWIMFKPRSTPTPPKPPPGVPTFITAAMLKRLRDIGLDDAQINALTPSAAWSILRELDPRASDPR